MKGRRISLVAVSLLTVGGVALPPTPGTAAPVPAKAAKRKATTTAKKKAAPSTTAAPATTAAPTAPSGGGSGGPPVTENPDDWKVNIKIHYGPGK